jgi:hypothetical protein
MIKTPDIIYSYVVVMFPDDRKSNLTVKKQQCISSSNIIVTIYEIKNNIIAFRIDKNVYFIGRYFELNYLNVNKFLTVLKELIDFNNYYLSTTEIDFNFLIKLYNKLLSYGCTNLNHTIFDTMEQDFVKYKNNSITEFNYFFPND